MWCLSHLEHFPKYLFSYIKIFGDSLNTILDFIDFQAFKNKTTTPVSTVYKCCPYFLTFKAKTNAMNYVFDQCQLGKHNICSKKLSPFNS